MTSVESSVTNRVTNIAGGSIRDSSARAVADLAEGYVLATVEVGVQPERLFRALTSSEIVAWWFRSGVFNTTEWTGDVRVGGHWRTSGVGRGKPYGIEGEFREIDPARRLVHTYQLIGSPGAPTTVTYILEPIDGGTRLTLRNTGFTSRASCSANSQGWEACFERLAEYLAPESVAQHAS